MTDFTKEKIGFAIALLATLFTVSPITAEFRTLGFNIFGFHLMLRYLYYFLALFLTLAVYFYAIQFLTERPLLFTQKLADISYAIAIVAPPFYLSLYVAVQVADLIAIFVKSDSAPKIVETGLGFLSGILSSYAVIYLRKIFDRREKKATVEQFEKEEQSFFDRAKSLFEAQHYDLCVVECYKAIEVVLRKSLFEKGVMLGRVHGSLIEITEGHKIINPDIVPLIRMIRSQRNNAAHAVEPISKAQASEVLNATSRVLTSMSALEDNR